jgi:Zn-finger nucleic acid-binding protein
MEDAAPISFKFRFIKKGQAAHIMSKKGQADDIGLELGGDRIRYEEVVDTTSRDNRLIVVFRPGAELGPVVGKNLAEAGIAIIEVYKIGVRTLERYIDRRSSLKQTEQRRARLAQEGKLNLFRTLACPCCAATVDVSELDRTTYVYCRFCESVFKDGGEVVTLGDVYRVCDECSIFDRVQSYTEFYFYFLLVVYGFSHKKRHLCDNCAGRTFWKVLAINAVFMLGVPSAIWMKVKSMRGREARLAELPSANALAKKGKVDAAHMVFATLYERLPDHPGLLYDQGLGALMAGRTDEGVGYLERSLKACANFLPSIQFLGSLSDALPPEGSSS